MDEQVKERIESYIVKQQNKFEEIRSFYLKSSNDNFAELNKQLIFVATVFLTFVSVVVTSESFDLSQEVMTLLKWPFGFLTVSIIFGVLQFFIDWRYFRDWAAVTTDVLEIVRRVNLSEMFRGSVTEIVRYENLDFDIADSQKRMKLQSNLLPITLQFLFLLLAIIFIGFGIFKYV